MLTREEAQKLRDLIHLMRIAPNNCGIDKVFFEFMEKITEKAKREIQVGDIYRNKDGLIVEITREDGNYVIGNKREDYEKNTGRSVRGAKYDLDISKRYNLVDAENELRNSKC